MVSLLEMQWERAKHAAAHMTSLITEIRSFGLGPCLPITMYVKILTLIFCKHAGILH